jgi:hypothetical protein
LGESLVFDKLHYVPILKWRQGEYLALERLTNSIKDWCTPLFELPVEPWDFETSKPKKTLDEHVEKLGARLKKNWGVRRCFFDSCHIPGDAKTSDGRHHVLKMFALTRSAGANAIPVTGIRRNTSFQTAIAQVMRKDGNGACIRLHPEDFEGGLNTALPRLLKLLDGTPGEVDLVIDSEAEVSSMPKAQSLVWAGYVRALPNVKDWRSVTVAGSSFPSSLTPPNNFRPTGDLDRHEWNAYAALVGRTLPRMPTFGDYAAAAFKTEFLDPRYIDPNAKVKYTIDGKWVVAVGKKVRATGRGQYQELCKAIRNRMPKVFEGKGYSWGDDFIADCAAGKGNGGTSTWPSVATNHHVTKVVRDIAKLFGASSVP